MDEDDVEGWWPAVVGLFVAGSASMRVPAVVAGKGSELPLQRAPEIYAWAGSEHVVGHGFEPVTSRTHDNTSTSASSEFVMILRGTDAFLISSHISSGSMGLLATLNFLEVHSKILGCRLAEMKGIP
ncbi:hypothetical protein KSP39_PZI006887 [Platanthera zijinensis]|uniref:Uncharacterized protein n=1 Tax=Platanthera zijinensis TaxID=2320716 RepID=A0AAP0BPD5_9ASPA